MTASSINGLLAKNEQLLDEVKHERRARQIAEAERDLLRTIVTDAICGSTIAALSPTDMPTS